MTQFSSLYGSRLDRELGSADSTQLFTTTRRETVLVPDAVLPRWAWVESV